MADIAVLHGGQGTIQTAVWAGTPVVGIGFQAEQQANIDGIARAGMAIRIPIYSVSHKKILNTIKKINQEKYKRNASLMKEKVRAVDGVQKTVELMNNFLLN
jgi:UDP:flavonoid glycosyltransferase YjiC (YdhE family)